MNTNLAYLSLGSNLGDKEAYLQNAVKYLEEYPEVKVSGKSSLYQTDPVGYKEQDFFLNAVIRVETSLDPFALLKKTQEVENRLGRKRIIRWGPRTIDIDILLYGSKRVLTPELTVPHPEMPRRRFVLVPLTELEHKIVIPNLGEVEKVLGECPDKSRVLLVKNANQW